MRALIAVFVAGLALAAPASAGISAFAIATQSPGHAEFTLLSDSQNAPGNLSVVNRCFDSESQLLSEESKPVDAWVSGPEGWVGRVAFDGPSDLSCYAALHKGGSPNALAVFSYISP